MLLNVLSVTLIDVSGFIDYKNKSFPTQQLLGQDLLKDELMDFCLSGHTNDIFKRKPTQERLDYRTGSSFSYYQTHCQ